MNEVLAFLKKSGTFYLATLDGDQPRVRPFGAITEIDGKLYLVTGNQKDVFRQIRQNPKVELCAMDTEGTWLRVTASLVPDACRAAKERMLQDVPVLRGMYAADDGVMEVLYLQDATATFASFGGAPRTIAF